MSRIEERKQVARRGEKYDEAYSVAANLHVMSEMAAAHAVCRVPEVPIANCADGRRKTSA